MIIQKYMYDGVIGLAQERLAKAIDKVHKKYKSKIDDAEEKAEKLFAKEVVTRCYEGKLELKYGPGRGFYIEYDKMEKLKEKHWKEYRKLEEQKIKELKALDEKYKKWKLKFIKNVAKGTMIDLPVFD